MASVYLHTNLENGKVYVGQTWQKPEDRWRMQRRDAAKNAPNCRYLNAAIRKYGWESFNHHVFGEFQTQSELDNLEKVWIILLQATNPKFGYNLQAGGSKGRQSDETRKRVSEYQKTHDNPGRFRKGQKCIFKRFGMAPVNKGISWKHAGSFATGHAPYCNHLGGYTNGNFCSRCGKEKQCV